MRVTLALAAILTAGLVAAATTLSGAPAGAQDTITVGIDANPTAASGNGPTSLSSIQGCVEIANSPGQQATLDVFVDSIPQGQNIGGFNYSLVFDESRFKIAAVDHDMLLAAAPGSSTVDLGGNPIPDEESPYSPAVADLDPDTAEQGPVAGVLSRYTVEVVPGAPAGAARFSLTEVTIGTLPKDQNPEELPITHTLDGLVAVGTSCPGELPTPQPVEAPDSGGQDGTGSGDGDGADGPGELPATGSTPGAGDGSDGGADGSADGPSDSSDGSSSGETDGETDGGTAAGGTQGDAAADGDGGGDIWPYIVGGLAAATALGGGAFWWWKRRTGQSGL